MTVQDRLLDEWLRGLKWSLTAIPSPEREDIVEETRGHIAERIDAGASLEDVLEAFGPPELYARRFVDEMEVSSALGSRQAAPLLAVVMQRAHRSLVAVLAVFGLIILAALALSAVGVISMELSDPVRTGFWWNGRGTAFLGQIDDPTSARELLGPGVYGVAIGLLTLVWIVGRWILIATVKTFARR